MKHLIGQTSSGLEVHVELIGSEAGRQISYQPHLLSLAKEMLEHSTPRRADGSLEYDMRRPIGYSSVVTTTDESMVLYGRLFKDDVYTRLVKNVPPETTHYLSLELAWDPAGSYTLTDIWIGRMRPPRPGSMTETPEGKDYWADHAVTTPRNEYGNERLSILKNEEQLCQKTKEEKK
jgi:hypothetical protein